MNKRSEVSGKRWIGGPALHAVLVLTVSWFASAQAATEGLGSDGAVGRQLPHHYNRPSLEGRVKMMSQALDLNATQQSELRRVLIDQREQIRMIWSDASVPAAYRVSATQSISDKTEDRIRALLNEEQRKKYNAPRQPHEMAAGSAPSVEDWMNAAKPK